MICLLIKPPATANCKSVDPSSTPLPAPPEVAPSQSTKAKLSTPSEEPVNLDNLKTKFRDKLSGLKDDSFLVTDANVLQHALTILSTICKLHFAQLVSEQKAFSSEAALDRRN
jgi:hypothetical protein